MWVFHIVGQKNKFNSTTKLHPEQKYMLLKTNVGHPGWVIKNKSRLILSNTDKHKSFVRILKTFRAGSAIYAPILINNKLIGQIICASQARNVMEEIDLSALCVLSNLASIYWSKLDGRIEIKKFIRIIIKDNAIKFW